MNAPSTKGGTMHERLRLAKRYLAIAESKDAKREAYKRAAEEIAAYKRETGLSIRAIAASLARDDSVIGKLLKWRDSGYVAETHFLMDKQATSRAAASHTKATLRDAPLEQVEQIITALPPERQSAIAAAAGDAYHKTRQEHREETRRRTPREEHEREEAKQELTQPLRRAVGGFAAMEIIDHLDMATEKLRELNADASLTPEAGRKIDRALDAFVAELKFAHALLGEEGE